MNIILHFNDLQKTVIFMINWTSEELCYIKLINYYFPPSFVGLFYVIPYDSTIIIFLLWSLWVVNWYGRSNSVMAGLEPRKSVIIRRSHEKCILRFHLWLKWGSLIIRLMIITIWHDGIEFGRIPPCNSQFNCVQVRFNNKKAVL